MNIQILGTNKSNDTRKAIRFFKERGISFHFRNVEEKGPSRGELENVSRSIDLQTLIDTDSVLYKKKGYQYMDFDVVEELMENPTLLKIPVVRNGRIATVGHVPDIWKQWIDSESNG